jgi:hypothetical protein
VRIEHCEISLMDYITGHLTEEEADVVRSHLRQCGQCQELYGKFIASNTVLQQTKMTMPHSIYYSSILPRIHEKRMHQRHFVKRNGSVSSRLILPLAVSVFLLTFLIKISPVHYFDVHQTDNLFQTMKGYSTDEIIQAAANEYAGISLFSNLETASESIDEQLRSDSFIREALAKQMENGEITDADLEDIFSGLNGNQVDKLLSGLKEREVL